MEDKSISKIRVISGSLLSQLVLSINAAVRSDKELVASHWLSVYGTLDALSRETVSTYGCCLFCDEDIRNALGRVYLMGRLMHGECFAAEELKEPNVKAVVSNLYETIKARIDKAERTLLGLNGEDVTAWCYLPKHLEDEDGTNNI